jgi:HAMP domain-containing protein
MMKIIKKIRAILLGKFSSIRDFYFFSAILGLAIVLTSCIFLLNDYLSFKSDVATSVKEQNHRIKRKLIDSILYTKYTMRYIGRQIANHDAQNNYKFINDLFVGYRVPELELISWSAFTWVNKSHKMVISSNFGIIKNPPDLSTRDYIPLTIQNPENIFIGRPVIGAISGLPLIPMGYGVVDRNRKYLGTVTTGILIDGLKSQITDLITNRNISFALVTAKGEEVIKSDDLNSDDGKEFFTKFLDKVNAKTDEKSFAYKHGYYQKLGDYPYGIITIYNHKFLASTTESRFIIYLIMIFSIISFAGLVFYTFHENLIAPISRLSAVAQQIYYGEPKQKIPEFKIAEINDLAKTLDMIDDLVSKQRKHDSNEKNKNK